MPRSRNFLIVLLFNAIALAMVIPALPLTLQALSSTLAESSFRYTLVVFIFLAVYILGSLQVGVLLDKRGRRFMLLFTLAANSLGFALLIVPVSFLQILLARALNGYGQISGNAIQASLSDLSSAQDRPQLFGLMNSILAFAFIIGSALAGLTSRLSNGLTMLYATSLLLSLCSLCFSILRCPETFRPKYAASNVKLRDLFSILCSQRLPSFLLLLCFYICNLGLLVIWPFYATYRFGWSAFESGLTLALMAIAFATSQAVVLPNCLRRFGFMPLVRFSIVSTALFFFGLGWTDDGLLFMLFPFLNLIGFTGISLVQGNLSSHFSASQQGALATLFALLSSLGTLIGLAVFALIMSWLSAAQITEGLIAGSPFYALGVILPLYCLWRPSRLVRSLTLPSLNS